MSDNPFASIGVPTIPTSGGSSTTNPFASIGLPAITTPATPSPAPANANTQTDTSNPFASIGVSDASQSEPAPAEKPTLLDHVVETGGNFLTSLLSPVSKAIEGVQGRVNDWTQNGIHPIDAIKNFFTPPAPAMEFKMNDQQISDRFGGDVPQLKTAIDTQSKDLTDLGNKIDTQNTNLKNLQANLDTTDQTAIDAYNAKVNALNSDVQTYKDKYASLTDTVDKYNTQAKKVPTEDFSPEDFNATPGNSGNAGIVASLYTKQLEDIKNGITPKTNISDELGKMAQEAAFNSIVAPVMGTAGGDVSESGTLGGGRVTNATLEQFAKESDPVVISNALVKSFKVPQEVADEVAPQLAKANTIQEVKDVLSGQPAPAPTETGPINVENKSANPFSDIGVNKPTAEETAPITSTESSTNSTESPNSSEVVNPSEKSLSTTSQPIVNQSATAIQNALNADAVKYNTTPEEIKRIFPDYVPPSVREQNIRIAFPNNADEIIALDKRAENGSSKALDALETAAGNPEAGTPQFKALYGTTDPKEVSDFFNFKINADEKNTQEVQAELPSILRAIKLGHDPIAMEKAKVIGENFSVPEIKEMTKSAFTSMGYTQRDAANLEELYPGLFKKSGSDINVATSTPAIPDNSNVVPNIKKQAQIDLLHRQLQRTADSLRNALANPVGHAKAYPTKTPAVYKARIAELNAKLDTLMPRSTSSTDVQTKDRTQQPSLQTQNLPDTLSPFHEEIMGQKPTSFVPNRTQTTPQLQEQKGNLSESSYNKNSPQSDNYVPTFKSVSEILNPVKTTDVNKARSIPVKSSDMPLELVQKNLQIQFKKEELENSPYKHLMKYVAKSGEFEGHLPEVTGGKSRGQKGYRKVSKWAERGDQIMQEFFPYATTYGDSMSVEDVRNGMDKYLNERHQLKHDIKTYNQDVKDWKTARRSEILAQRDEKALDEIAKIGSQPLATTLEELEPPSVRGNLQGPKLDLAKWKDPDAFSLSRDTFERNIEKAAPKGDVAKIKEFITDPIKANDTEKVQFINNERTLIKDGLSKIGITSYNEGVASLIQRWGEGLVNEEQLATDAKKLKIDPLKIKQAASLYRERYDNFIDNEWNPRLKEYDYKPIPKRKDYFHHFSEISWWTQHMGFFNGTEKLPTEIAGETEFFNPGRPFSPAQLQRLGKKTAYDAVKGFDRYIESAANQAFHVDSIQRLRWLQKYINQAAEVARHSPEGKLDLSNFKTHLVKYTSGVAGKLPTLDRNIEELFGRGRIKGVVKLAEYIGRNIIVGNVSAALTHLLVTLPYNMATVEKVPLIKGAYETMMTPLRADKNTIDGQTSAYLTRRYPVKNTLPSNWDKVQSIGGIFLHVADRFKTTLAVASKYYELTNLGMKPEEAMKKADEYAGRIIGDNSTGQIPILMRSKVFAVGAQFQRGLNDSLSILLHDIPNNSFKFKNVGTEEEPEFVPADKNTASAVWAYSQWLIYAFGVGLLVKQLKGTAKGLDPIGATLTASGLNDEGKGQNLGGRLKTAGTDVLGELPFTSLASGQFPLAQSFSPISNYTSGKESAKQSLIDLLSEFASPVGGGLQAKKTVEGIQSYNQGYATSKTGKPTYVINKTPANFFRSALFGPTAVPEAQSYYNGVSAKGSPSDNPQQATYDNVQALIKAGKTDEAQTIVDGLTDAEYKQYQTLKTQAKNTEASANTDKYLKEVLDSGIVQKVNTLKAAGKTDEAQTLLDNAFPDTPEGDAKYNAYKEAKKLVTASNNINGADTSRTWDKQSLGEHIANVAQAVGMHPVQFFDDVFHNMGDWKVTGIENGQVIVARAPTSETNAIRQASGKNNAGWQLDHTIPIEIGGSNRGDNLTMMSKADDDANSPVENYLGNKLKDGTITGPQAREYILRFKGGAGQPMSANLQSEYENKYGGKAMTFDDIRAVVEGK